MVYPTETLYGLGALATHAGAVERLALAKGRPDGKAMPLLGADLAQVEAVAVLGPLAGRAVHGLGRRASHPNRQRP